MSFPITSQQTDAREFVAFWTGKGYEKGQAQPFWSGLLRVLGVRRRPRIHLESTSRHVTAIPTPRERRHGGVSSTVR